jgi:zona occludens toxin
MAVCIVAGTPGAGKTYYALQELIIPALKRGRKVLTNIEGLDKFKIALTFDIEIVDIELLLEIMTDKEDICRFYERAEKNILIVIDEAQNYFHARSWDTKNNRDMVPYITQARHYGHDVFFITQHAETIDTSIRRLTDVTYYLRSLKILGVKRSAMLSVFLGADHVRGAAPWVKKPWRHDKRVGHCYASYVAEDVKEQGKFGSVFNDTRFKILLIASVILLFISVRSIRKSGFMGVKTYKKNVPVQRAEQVKQEERKKEIKKEYGENCYKRRYRTCSSCPLKYTFILNNGEKVEGKKNDYRPCGY